MAQKNKAKQGKRVPAYSADSMAVCLILGLLLIALGVLIFLATAVGLTGDVFLGLKQLARGLTGTLGLILPVIPIWGGVLVVMSTQRKPPLRPFVLACVMLVLICAAATLLTFVGSQNLMDYIASANRSRGAGEDMGAFLTRAFDLGGTHGVGGGLLGMLLAWPLWTFLSAIPGAIIVILLAIVTFLFLIKLDVKGIAGSMKARQDDRRMRSEQQQAQLRQQELAWQQEQMRIQQEQMRLQQEQRRLQEQQRQQHQSSWEGMMPDGAANWNSMQGYQQQMQMPVQQKPVPVVQQVQPVSTAKPARQKKQKPQFGFQPTPEENGQYAPPQPMPEAQYEDEEPAPKKKRTGLFKRDKETEPVALPRRKGLFDRTVEEEESFQQPVEEVPPRRRSIFPSEQEELDVPDVIYTEEEPIFEEPEPAPIPAPEDNSFKARLQRAQAAANAPADKPARKSRKDTPSAWTNQESSNASWRNDEEWPQPAARSTGRSAARAAATPAKESPYARPAAAENKAPAPQKQKPTSSWADTPPWEDSPEYYEIEQPQEAVVPVLTQKRPEGAWEADLKLPPKRNGSSAPDETMFEEHIEIPYVFPSMDLLKKPEPQQGISEEEDALRSRRLENTLQSFRVPAKVRHITHGPAISRFELELAAGIKVSKVTDLNRNIAMNMEVKSVRIEAPIPGKSLVGVEVPNKHRATVTLREVLEADVMQTSTKPLVVALGKDIAGTPIICDLAKMPHLLIAGATGSGKSVCINTIINSLLYRCSPKDVRLILVDPKVVELQCYNGIPHLLIPVVSDPHKASGALAWAVGEMMDRYKRFQEAGVRAIDGYNDSLPEGEEKMPRIVIIIDELADLMMTCKKDVEERICRLAQLARAAGIHLIVATQRPSVDVITGLIKANIPSRIAFKVSSNVDSRTILDRIGAEQLLGNGDMLYLPTGEFTPIRVQGCFLSDPEVNRITDFIRESCPSDYDPAVLEELERLQGESEGSPVPDMMGGGEELSTSDGSLLAQCIEMAVNDGQVSTSLIQRRLKLGYARAGRLVDEMEKRGIISQKDGAKPRMCLISRDEFEAMKAAGDLD
ncbi:MAG: DNA translocase FtsK [Clostridia bacterium]|nr:DNA translocase FtsK [Clostridia bacterium]